MKYLIVARHLEDLTWLSEIPDAWTPFVVYKDVDIPNEGREASSYFYALSTIQYRPGDTLAFLQGEPFAHIRADVLRERLDGPIEGFTWLGEWVVADDHDGHPHHGNLPVGEKFDKWIGGKRPEEFEFAAGAQFAMPAEYALQYDRAFYERMMLEANEDDNPWIFERLWRYLFDKENA